MDLIYPNEGLKIYIPKDLNGEYSAAIFEMAHKNPAAEIYWYMDQQFLGNTKRNHKMEIVANQGIHEFVFIDELGNTFQKNIEFIFR
jgi:penicillin-binding protein 1C